MSRLTHAASQSFRLHGTEFHSYASSRSGAAELGGWRADFAPHTPGQAHSMSREELILVLAGALDVELGQERFTARQGDAILVPAGSLFRVSNNADRAAQAWVVTTLGMTATMARDQQLVTPPWAQ
jgi:quercetin dioxygenase-like cupin family protein